MIYSKYGTDAAAVRESLVLDSPHIHNGAQERVRKSQSSQTRPIMSTIQYMVHLTKSPSSDWGASVPDLPGCVATGKTLDATLRRIESAIQLHLEGLREDGLKVPRPRHRTFTPRRTRRRVDFYATVLVAA